MKFLVVVPIESVRGDQTFAVDAESEAEAKKIVENGGGEFVEDSIEIMELNWDCVSVVKA